MHKLAFLGALGALTMAATLASTQAAGSVVTPYPVRSAEPAQPNFWDAAASAPDDIWSVGVDGSGPGIATHWDGSQWTWVPIAHARTTFLTTVDTLSADDAWAAGHTFHLVHDRLRLEHWDGTSWSFVEGVGPTGELVIPTDMSSVGSDVWLAGTVDRARQGRSSFIRHFDGRTWESVPSPRADGSSVVVDGIYAGSPSDVWVVGMVFSPSHREYAAHWNGRRWHRAVTGPFAGVGRWGEVTSVVGRGTTLWAAGTTTKRFLPVFLRRDSTGWHQFRIDGAATAFDAGPVATPPKAAPWVATNGSRCTVLRRTGSSWERVGNPGGVHRISIGRSLLVFSHKDAWLVGPNVDQGAARLHWDGTQWRSY